ncbi:MAG TPA: hypothetical protein VE821_03185 [Pyrinomonadaceae bacterium]|nr:hypothetical protein [Pyrinomonadaceae bacterium]
MRWKLLLIASLAATVVGAGGSLGLAYWLRGVAQRFAAIDPLLLSTLLIPLIAITYAAVFVYRHTARRRKLQATMTVLLALMLTLIALSTSALILTRRSSTIRPAPTPTPHNTT